MRSQRFWMPVGMLAASFIGGGLASVGFADKDPAIPEVIMAQSFQVVADGKVRGVFAAAANGRVGLDLYDKDGKQRGLFGLTRGEVALALLDKDSRVRGVFHVRPNGGTGLVLRDKDGKPRGGFAVQPDGLVALELFDKDGKHRAVLHVRSDGVVGLELADKYEKAIFQAP